MGLKTGVLLFLLLNVLHSPGDALLPKHRAQRRAELRDRLASEEDHFEADERFERLAKSRKEEQMEEARPKQKPSQPASVPGNPFSEEAGARNLR